MQVKKKKNNNNKEGRATSKTVDGGTNGKLFQEDMLILGKGTDKKEA